MFQYLKRFFKKKFYYKKEVDEKKSIQKIENELFTKDSVWLFYRKYSYVEENKNMNISFLFYFNGKSQKVKKINLVILYYVSTIF